MKLKNYTISLAIVFFISFSFLTPALANEWMVQKEDELVFDLTVWDEDDITVAGSITLTIDNINSTGGLIYSINTEFEIDENDLKDDIEVDNANTTSCVCIGSFKVPFMLYQVLLFSEDSFNEQIDLLDDHYEHTKDLYDSNYGDDDSIIYSVKKLLYGIEYSLEDTKLEKKMYNKWQWDKNGIIKHFERTKIENNVKTGIKITKNEFKISSFPVEIFLAICAISTIGKIIRSKKQYCFK